MFSRFSQIFKNKQEKNFHKSKIIIFFFQNIYKNYSCVTSLRNIDGSVNISNLMSQVMPCGRRQKCKNVCLTRQGNCDGCDARLGYTLNLLARHLHVLCTCINALHLGAKIRGNFSERRSRLWEEPNII